MSENNTDQADERKESGEVADNGPDQNESPAADGELNKEELAQGGEEPGQGEVKEGVTEEEKEEFEDLTNQADADETLTETQPEELVVESEVSEDTEGEAAEEMSISGNKDSSEKTESEVDNSEPKKNLASVDVADSTQGAASVELELISSNLKVIEKQLSALQNPTDKQLDKAKKLILALTGVTGIVLVASITFFVVMSVSIAQKVDDLDRVLMAVAKRGIQLADGIETISGMESKLKQLMDQNAQILPSLSGIEMKIMSAEEQINDNAEKTSLAIQAQGSSILKSQDYLKNNLEEEVSRVEALIKRSVKLKPLEQEHIGLKRQLEKIDSSIAIVEARVQDLYVIKQAEIETAYKGLSSSE